MIDGRSAAPSPEPSASGAVLVTGAAGFIAAMVAPAPYLEHLEQDVTFDDGRARAVLAAAGVPALILNASAVAGLGDLALARCPTPVPA